MAKTKSSRACPVCGTQFTGELCPVCVLRGALGNEETVSQSVGPTLSHSEFRFEHYEVLTHDDGTPLELGRGAMGVTYKAIDVNLRCPVTLKVINEKYLGDESARRRFVREARAAASVRHPNVASVFHLGKSGHSYFYAMEYVDGQPLDKLIRRSGKLEVKQALEIMSQVASGLGAVHKQNLVHRDIKPSNLMVSLEGDGLTAKIIDLGLAKIVGESQSETAASIPGAFAGTPEFPSPEQFAGVGVDIRSDLYSLGATLWQMLSGKLPFRGTPAELMHQHLHATLPIRQLGRVPQPLVALLEVLLKKYPARRFQNPQDLLKVTPMVRRAMETRRTLKRQKLHATLVDKPRSQPRESPAAKVPKRSIAVLPFDTLSQDKGNTYFADGVHDEILSNLAKVSRLRVISRTSVMMYRPGGNWNLRSIFTTLGVANVLEGTVRRDDNRIPITVRLVDARRGEALWADSYDRDLIDIFAIQSEVAQTIASKLTATLSPEEKKRIEAKPTENLEAYDLYLRARKLMTSFKISAAVENVEKVLRDAINLLKKAVGIDPKFALAHCASAQAHDLLYFLYDPTPERRALGDAAVDNALTLEPDLPEAHITCANHLYRCYRDYERARVQ